MITEINCCHFKINCIYRRTTNVKHRIYTFILLGRDMEQLVNNTGASHHSVTGFSLIKMTLRYKES